MFRSRTVPSSISGSRKALALVSALTAALLALLAIPGVAQAPKNGTLAPNGATVTWKAVSPAGASEGEATCVEGANCETFSLTLSGTEADWAGKQAHVEVKWASTVNDYDIFVHKGNNSGPMIGSSAQGSTNSEAVDINPNGTLGSGTVGTGVFTVRVVYFAVAPGDPYTGTATPIVAAAPPPPGASPTPPPPPPQGAPSYFNYVPPAGLGRSAGEPSIGVNWKTGNVMYQAGLETLRVTFDDCTSPAKATWVNKPAANTATITLDPILFTDRVTGRTVVSQLSAKTSLMSFTDNDGDTYTPSEGGAILQSGVDHQTVGGGPYRPGTPGSITPYPHAIYYASQDIAEANIALSRDGALTFQGNGTAIPMYNLTQCGGLHGHVKVAPDGTVYVPNKGCGSNQAVLVSTDNGLTWNVRKVPNSKPNRNDPSIATGINNVGRAEGQVSNTIYFGYANQDGHARIAVSRDRGATWTDDQDVGAALGVQNTAFPVVVAGDDNRAAFAFLGSTATGGDATGDDPDAFSGEWHLYIATTYDGGKTWVTIDATPTDPVQRGIICLRGTVCETGRNLLDFNDMSIDKEGRPLVAYADGCIGDCVQGGANSGTDVATIARQAGGRTLFAANDPAGPRVPGGPLVTATLTGGTTVRLTWPTPDSGGSPITGYNVYRGAESGAETRIATLGAGSNSYEDAQGGAIFLYRVTAVNAVGESASCAGIFPTAQVIESPCALPGRTVAEDPTGDQLAAPNNKDLDIQKIAIAEPFFEDGSNKLVFTMKVADLKTLPPNRQFRILWTPKTPPSATENRFYVGMNTNAGGSASAATYEYGTVTSTGNAPTRRGAADAGSINPDGTIRITIANSKVGDPKAGETLSTVSGRTFAGNGNANVSLAVSADSSGDSAYNLVGNAFCVNGGPGDVPPPTLARLLNISTRSRVQGGENVLIGGFIINGTAPKQVVVRAIGPSLNVNGQPVEGRLEDPVLSLHDQNGVLITENDNWKDNNQEAAVRDTGLPPSDDRESTIVRSLIPGPYTAIMSGKDNASGIGLVEAYDRGQADSKLANISSRGAVETQDNVLIGGFIVGGGTTGPVRVVARAIGPSLAGAGVANSLQDPTLQLVDANGGVILENDDYATSNQRAEIDATGLAPSDQRESAVLAAVPLGNFTAVVRGKGNTQGVGLVEVYNVGNP